MNKKWFRFLAIIPLIAFLTVTNIYEDPGNIFHDDSASIAKAILAGNAVYYGSGNANERGIKQRLIENMPKQVECLSIGPSLSLGIRKTNVGTDSYYNISASSLLLYEYLSFFGMLEINNIKADRIIMCIDSYFFDEKIYSEGTRYPEMMNYSTYMLELLKGENPVPPKNDYFGNLKTKIGQAFSITYFQSSISLIQHNNSYITPYKRWGIMNEATANSGHFESDASWVYDFGTRSSTEENVVNHAESYAVETKFSKGSHITDFSKETLIQLINYYQSKGTEIVFYLCPLAPALWDRIESLPDRNEYYVLDEIEAFAKEIAEEYSIKITGSYNPYNLGVTNADFLDSRHIRHDRLEAYFDFKS